MKEFKMFTYSDDQVDGVLNDNLSDFASGFIQ
jgi:hypothetical protein